jgi:hypothetical protein
MEPIGIDVHKRGSLVCALAEGGEVVLERRWPPDGRGWPSCWASAQRPGAAGGLRGEQVGGPVPGGVGARGCGGRSGRREQTTPHATPLSAGPQRNLWVLEGMIGQVPRWWGRVMRVAAKRGRVSTNRGKRSASATRAAWLRARRRQGSPAALHPPTRVAGAPSAAMAPAVRGALRSLATADGCSAGALAPGLSCAAAPSSSPPQRNPLPGG